jgi:hypothetical protein
MSLRLSSKHGANPSVQKCFWCGGDIGVVLFGAMKGDAEAPRAVVLSYEPCDSCKAMMDRGVTLVEVTERPPLSNPGQDPIQANPPAYPTGRWSVITREAAGRLFRPQALVDQVVKVGRAWLDVETYELLGLHDATGTLDQPTVETNAEPEEGADAVG